MTFYNLLLIGAGGFLGTIARYSIGIVFETKEQLNSFPYSTFIVNLLGSLILGIIVGFTYHSEIIKPEIKLFLTIGFCGGFTTFSTFIFENYQLAKGSQLFTLFSYTLLSVLLGFVFLYVGIIATKSILQN